MQNEVPKSDQPADPTASHSIGLGELLSALERIEALLSAESAAVLSRKQAANFLGLSPASLDRLASSNPALKPIHPTPGRTVWRKADLQRYIEGL
jgi:predicted DNA-binding transcriptional regulator AlpA